MSLLGELAERLRGDARIVEMGDNMLVVEAYGRRATARLDSKSEKLVIETPFHKIVLKEKDADEFRVAEAVRFTLDSLAAPDLLPVEAVFDELKKLYGEENVKYTPKYVRLARGPVDPAHVHTVMITVRLDSPKLGILKGPPVVEHTVRPGSIGAREDRTVVSSFELGMTLFLEKLYLDDPVLQGLDRAPSIGETLGKAILKLAELLFSRALEREGISQRDYNFRFWLWGYWDDDGLYELDGKWLPYDHALTIRMRFGTRRPDPYELVPLDERVAGLAARLAVRSLHFALLFVNELYHALSRAAASFPGPVAYIALRQVYEAYGHEFEDPRIRDVFRTAASNLHFAVFDVYSASYLKGVVRRWSELRDAVLRFAVELYPLYVLVRGRERSGQLHEVAFRVYNRVLTRLKVHEKKELALTPW